MMLQSCWCSLVRRKMACVVNFASKSLISKILLSRYKHISLRCLTTCSKNNKEAPVSTEGKSEYAHIPDFSKPLENKNWVSYGYDYEDEKLDKVKKNGLMFFTVTLGLVGMTMLFAYMPDFGRKDWARREAFIRLQERELLGLEPIDPNYVDPSKIVLPSDEELGDMEIII